MSQIIPVEFPYKDIHAISEKQFEVHMSLYKGYVKKINEIWKKLEDEEYAERAEAAASYSRYRGLKTGETYCLDGVILHELYFANMGGQSNTPSGDALTLINRDFSSFEKWKEDFTACGKASRGWAVLAYDQRSKRLLNFLSDAHDVGVIWTAYPILVMDVYEHAYFVDYASNKAEYIERFIQDINWDVVNNRAKVLPFKRSCGDICPYCSQFCDLNPGHSGPHECLNNHNWS